MNKPNIFICGCHSLEHQIVVEKDEEDDLIYFNIHLKSKGFFGRLIIGLKYIFGYKSKNGEWDTFIFKNEDLNRFYASTKNNYNDIKEKVE